MAQEIVYDFDKMKTTADEIREIGQRLGSIGQTLEQEFDEAVQNWEGASKDKMVEFMKGTVREYTQVRVPDILDALATLLETDAQTMSNADQAVADSIQQSISGTA